MAVSNLNKTPTPFEELRLLESIYKSNEALHRTLGEYGYSILTEVKVSEVRCFLFVLDAFPRTQRKVTTFDFAEHAGNKMTVGICIGGTTICSGWDVKSDLFLQGIMKSTEDYEKANTACTQILRALTSFQEEYPQLSTHAITLDIRVCGYSLGGLFAQATTVLLSDWVRCGGHKISCRTYDCPGVQDHYHQMARRHCNGQMAPWRDVITNYKSMPSPLNTVFKDIGRVIHLYSPDQQFCDEKWIVTCIAGSVQRVTYWTSLFETIGNMFSKTDFNLLNPTMQRVSMGMAVVAKLGIDIADVIENHKLSTMLKCFDEAGALLPGVCIEMRQWPVYNDFKETAAIMLERSGADMVPFDPDNAGLHTLFGWGGKRGFIERKLASLPGYRRMAHARL